MKMGQIKDQITERPFLHVKETVGERPGEHPGMAKAPCGCFLQIQHQPDFDIGGDCACEIEAEAHLCPVHASAPELLAACERVLRAIQWSKTADRMTEQEQAEMLRDAIASPTQRAHDRIRRLNGYGNAQKGT